MPVFNVSYTTEITAHKYTQTDEGIFFEDADEILVATFPAGGTVTPKQPEPIKSSAEHTSEEVVGWLNEERIGKEEAEQKARRKAIMPDFGEDNAREKDPGVDL